MRGLGGALERVMMKMVTRKAKRLGVGTISPVPDLRKVGMGPEVRLYTNS
jgi:hypothetical protein